MTENDPHAHDSAEGRQNPGAQPGTEGQAAWSQSPTPGATPASGEQATQQTPGYPQQGDAYSAPNPWSAQGAQTGPVRYHPYPSAGGTTQQQPYAAPGTAVYSAPSNAPKKSGSGKLLASVAAIALVIGGVAGGTVGYLTGGSSGPSVNALDQPKPAQQTGNAPAGSVESVAQKLSPSVVELQVAGRTAAGEGSGFVLSTDGYILTNNHVVEVAANGGQIRAVFQDGKKAAAKIVGRDPTTDIAVVKVSGVSGLSPVELGRSDDLRVGQPVVAIGSPFELSGTVTSGIVSSLHRPVQASGDETDQATVMDAIQTDAAINPGNSGGPLANMNGQVIGINSAIYSPNGGQGGPSGQSQGGNVGIGFAIPIDQARRTADDIIKTGHATQTFIGAKVADAPQGGAQLGDITPGSPAEKAGLKSGDVVTKIDDRTIDSADTLIAAIRTRAPDEKVTFTLSGGRTVQVTLGGQPVPAN
ncbi:trypsin-like peptidase domain-containing protein [Amycolatopsis sp. FDAARGOS 1241]|uniref:trypsin-like peptidase domain-containing protein n=1 Tax=Amycolatopsis sp. FDAARGOS 1241 TaxID=2778070 RepID=UPI00194F5DA8|nr:trypsin-like peptidase domain-containing protein [Amycolatopsis sp. FDAARGOS 1241]QRP46935.1 trypsin-like peptidase domain-containing protein [Amycolatopsis sp. FDAARGOS 1241]